ncbi:MAG: ABC transporter permease [Planctomycetota bacterium]
MQTAQPGFFARRLPTFYGWVGNFGWPILLKQLRVEFRRNRFLYCHFASLALLAGWLLTIVSTEATNLNVKPTQVGQSIFNSFLNIQTCIVVFLFPLFGATSFTQERANLSLDFLTTSTLSAEEIVWGKFLASGLYCLLYVAATVPLLAISFLFGGVTVSDVLVAYGGLISATVLISMLAICVSSWFKSSVGALITTYSLMLLAAVVIWFVYIVPVDAALADDPNQTTISALKSQFGLKAENRWIFDTVRLFDALAIFFFLFLVAANRVRPAADDHASKFRILALVYFPLRIVGGFYQAFGDHVISNDLMSSEQIDAEMSWLAVFGGIALLVQALVFSTEEADLSNRNRSQFVSWRGIRYPFRVFSPGAFWGSVYALGLTVLCCALLGGLFHFHLADVADEATILWVNEVVLTLPIYVAGFVALGFLLSVSAFTPLYSRLTVSFIFIITVLLPKIFHISLSPDSVYNLYYLSPWVLWSSLEYIQAPPELDEVQYRLFGFHQIDIAKVVFAGLFVLLGLVGLLVAKRSSLPLLRFVGRPQRAEPKTDQPAAAAAS